MDESFFGCRSWCKMINGFAGNQQEKGDINN